mmetsp:Transcript_6287/g.18055  ORF Transcript_6287/g.18055 Transcript_6287/m.18055 type:complete len:496 (+) Transcript_6287:148-1635(+)
MSVIVGTTLPPPRWPAKFHCDARHENSEYLTHQSSFSGSSSARQSSNSSKRAAIRFANSWRPAPPATMAAVGAKRSSQSKAVAKAMARRVGRSQSVVEAMSRTSSQAARTPCGPSRARAAATWATTTGAGDSSAARWRNNASKSLRRSAEDPAVEPASDSPPNNKRLAASWASHRLATRAIGATARPRGALPSSCAAAASKCSRPLFECAAAAVCNNFLATSVATALSAAGASESASAHLSKASKSANAVEEAAEADGASARCAKAAAAAAEPPPGCLAPAPTRAASAKAVARHGSTAPGAEDAAACATVPQVPPTSTVRSHHNCHKEMLASSEASAHSCPSAIPGRFSAKAAVTSSTHSFMPSSSGGAASASLKHSTACRKKDAVADGLNDKLPNALRTMSRAAPHRLFGCDGASLPSAASSSFGSSTVLSLPKDFVSRTCNATLTSRRKNSPHNFAAFGAKRRPRTRSVRAEVMWPSFNSRSAANNQKCTSRG